MSITATSTTQPAAAEIGPAGWARPRLCVVGPMVGRHHGRVTHQGQIVADGLRAAGYEVLAVSAQANRYMRLADIIATLLRNRRRIDVLIVQVYGGPSFVVEDIASRFGRLFQQRIVMVLHGGAMPTFMSRFPAWSRRVLQRADVIVTPSRFLSRALEGHALDARVIPNTIHLTDYEYRHRARVRPRLLWMRSFHDTYNPMMAVRTLARLRKSFPDASLVMAGQDSGLEAEVRAAASRLGLDEAIRFPGFLDAAGKRRESRDADVFLNTNRVDNMPVAIVEAAAMGLPVVAAGVGGICDLLTDGETGLIVPDDDDAAMAEAVQRLLLEPGLAGRLSAEGRRLAEQSSWDNVRPRWEQTFREVAAPSLA
ncbi:MAG: glycosyltransferase family 4 protein [Vicinamibacterales bacterium]